MNKTKKLLLTGLSVALVAIIAVFGTIAYLTDTDSDVNVMTLGNVQIEQIEQERDSNGTLVDFTQNKPAYPAVGDIAWDKDKLEVNGGNYKVFDKDLKNVIDKIVTVKNNGKSDAYVRTIVAFEAPEGFNDDLYHFNYNSTDVTLGSNWHYIEIDGARYVTTTFTYNDVLAAGETSAPSLMQVFLDKATTNEDVEKLGETIEILVISQACQVEGFANAETALNAAFGELNAASEEDSSLSNAAVWFREAIKKAKEEAEAALKDTWDGTVDDSWYEADTTVFTLDSAEQLAGLNQLVTEGYNFAGKTVKLDKDVDLSGTEWDPIGSDSVYFAGEFDGQGHTIENLNQSEGARMGLFGLVEKAYIHDLTMKNVDFNVSDDNARVGAIAGNLQYWNVLENVTIDGIDIEISGDNGLVGTVSGYAWKSQFGNVDVKNVEIEVIGTGNSVGGHTAYGRAHVWDTDVTGNNANWLDGTVQMINEVEYVLQNYWEDCDVEGVTIKLLGNANEAGGFIGSDTYNSHSNFYVNCHVKNLDVTAESDTTQNVGGFIAWNNGTTSAGTVKGFDGCSVTGEIVGANGTYGGFVGQVGGRACEYYNATADVEVNSTGISGGFVGITQAYSTHKYIFDRCVANGDVTGNVAGGFAGKNGLSGDGKSVFVDYINCEAKGTVSGLSGGIAGGFIGEVNTELPSTNWNIVDSIGYLNLIGNKASTSVTCDNSSRTNNLIGYFDGVANGDAREGNKVIVTLRGNTPESGINLSEDTSENDIIIGTE